jgi:hypothetical protein
MTKTKRSMSLKAAGAEARKRWGDRWHVQEKTNAPTPEQRTDARGLMLLNRDTKGVLDRVAVLEAQHVVLTYRCAVGYVTNIGIPMFHVQGEGDTWEEAFAKADARKDR